MGKMHLCMRIMYEYVLQVCVNRAKLHGTIRTSEEVWNKTDTYFNVGLFKVNFPFDKLHFILKEMGN